MIFYTDDAQYSRPTRIPTGRSLGLDDIQIEKEDSYPLTASDAIRNLFEIIKERPFVTIGISFLFYVVVIFGGGVLEGLLEVFLEGMAHTDETFQNLIRLFNQSFSIINSISSTLFISGFISILWLRLLRGQGFTLSDMKPLISSFFPLVLTCFLTTFIIMAGFLFFIVPGVMLWLGLSMVPMLVIDKNLRYLDAIQASWRLMKGHKGDYFVFAFVMGLLNIVGALACGIGLLITVPISIAGSVAYYANIAAAGNAYDDSSSDSFKDVFS